MLQVFFVLPFSLLTFGHPIKNTTVWNESAHFTEVNFSDSSLYSGINWSTISYDLPSSIAVVVIPTPPIPYSETSTDHYGGISTTAEPINTVQGVNDVTSTQESVITPSPEEPSTITSSIPKSSINAAAVDSKEASVFSNFAHFKATGLPENSTLESSTNSSTKPSTKSSAKSLTKSSTLVNSTKSSTKVTSSTSHAVVNSAYLTDPFALYVTS